MRFVWLQEQGEIEGTANPGALNQVLFTLYNVLYWVPLIPAILGAHGVGFVSFALVIVVRAFCNFYRVNVLTPEQGAIFPFRSP